MALATYVNYKEGLFHRPTFYCFGDRVAEAGEQPPPQVV